MLPKCCIKWKFFENWGGCFGLKWRCPRLFSTDSENLYIIWPILKWIEWTSYFCYYEPFQKDLFCFCCPHHFYISQVKSFEDLAILFIGSIIMYFGWEMKRFFCFSKPSADVLQDISPSLVNSCIFQRVVFKTYKKQQHLYFSNS